MKQLPKDIRQQAAYWLPVCPVHLIADRDTLILAPPESLCLSMEEAKQLAICFNQHFSEDGYSLHVTSELVWFMGMSQRLDLKFSPLSKAVGTNLRDAWQQGRDAQIWRKLLNETQMLWFSHEVNQLREREEKLPINGLWVNRPSSSFVSLLRRILR